MNDTTMNNTCELDARELRDAELDFVSGGFGFWDAVGVVAGGIARGAGQAYVAAVTDTGI